jgi:3'(2'), 5'-bisphosphate nucleotidase
MTDPFDGRSHSDLAGDIAERAGALLLQLRSEWEWATDGAGPSKELGRRGDRESNELILSELGTHRSGDSVLSEESADDPRRLGADRVWIVDPLDGTREFSMQGRTDWAVHVALWEAGAGITAAAVSQPALAENYVTGRLNPSGGPDRAPEPVVLVSDSRPPDFAPGVARRAGLEIRSMGSAGAKAMAVVRGEASAYLHAGGQWEWDSAAPVGVALSAGLHASRIDGSPLLYNQERPYLPDLLICHTDVAARLLEALSEVPAG